MTTQPQPAWVTVPREATEEMLAAALEALANWRKTLSADEALLRRVAPMENGRQWMASATPREKAVIRYAAMIAAAPPPPAVGREAVMQTMFTAMNNDMPEEHRQPSMASLDPEIRRKIGVVADAFIALISSTGGAAS